MPSATRWAAPSSTARRSSQTPYGSRRRGRIAAIDDRNSFRRHENACCFYRERWIPEDGRRTPEGELVLYEVYCLQDMPPATPEEQAQCFRRRTTCWRTGELLSRMPRPSKSPEKAASR